MIWLRRLLFPFAWLYRAITSLRNRAYEKGWMPAYSFDLPVIVLGNLNTGGSGKTPHTIWLAEMLYGKYNLAFLSRGYGRKTTGFHLAGDDASALQIGDEPMQYWTRFLEAEVAVGEDRPLAISTLLSLSPNIDVILLDDAYQHRSLKAGLNILITEYNDPYFRDRLLPAGNLRESIAGAARADWIIVSKCPEKISPAEKVAFIQEMQPLEGQQVFFTWMQYGPLKALNNVAQQFPGSPQNAVLFTGIAHPEPLVRYWEPRLKKLQHVKYADHHHFQAHQLQYLCKKAQQLGPDTVLITTEKDAMRLLNTPLMKILETMPLFMQPIQVQSDPETEQQLQLQLLNFVQQYPRRPHNFEE